MSSISLSDLLLLMLINELITCSKASVTEGKEVCAGWGSGNRCGGKSSFQ